MQLLLLVHATISPHNLFSLLFDPKRHASSVTAHCSQTQRSHSSRALAVHAALSVVSLQLESQSSLPSHASAPSCTPLPQRASQFGSVLALDPSGQHASSGPMAVTASGRQAALHVLSLPVSFSIKQASRFSQLVGHGVAVPGSHVSPLVV